MRNFFFATYFPSILRLFKAYKSCNELTVAAIRYLLNDSSSYKPVSKREAFNEIEKFDVVNDPSDLVLVNTLARAFQTVNIVAVNETFSQAEVNFFLTMELLYSQIDS